MIRHALAALLTMGLSAPPAHAQFEAAGEHFFLAADVNGDTALTLAEFRTFIRLMADAGAPMSQRIVNLAAYRVAFARVDANGDGLVSPEELRAAEQAN